MGAAQNVRVYNNAGPWGSKTAASQVDLHPSAGRDRGVGVGGGRFASAVGKRQRDGGERGGREGGRRRSVPDTDRGVVHLKERERTSTPGVERDRQTDRDRARERRLVHDRERGALYTWHGERGLVQLTRGGGVYLIQRED